MASTVRQEKRRIHCGIRKLKNAGLSCCHVSVLQATAAHRELDLATEHIQELQSALQTERAAAAAQDSSAQNAADERARLQRDLDALTGELRAQTAALLHEKRQLTEALESKKRAAETAQALVRRGSVLSVTDRKVHLFLQELRSKACTT